MSSYTTGLTSLKTQPPSNSISDDDSSASNFLYNQDPKKIGITQKGFSVEAEVLQLTRTKDRLTEEMKTMTEQRNSKYRELSSELGLLSKQKTALLKQIKELGDFLTELQIMKDKGEVNFNQFFSSREDILVKFASAASGRIAKRLETAEKAEELVSNHEKEVIKRESDASSLEKRSLEGLQRVAEAEKRVSDEAKVVFDQSKWAKETAEKANQEKTDADAMLNNASRLLEQASKEKKTADKYAKAKTSLADKKDRDSDVRLANLMEREKYHTIWEDKLKKKELRLLDKEETIKRNYARMKRSGWSGV